MTVIILFFFYLFSLFSSSFSLLSLFFFLFLFFFNCFDCFTYLVVLFLKAKNEKQQPLTIAVNAAASMARGEYLFFLTDSTELTPSSISPLLSHISSSSSSSNNVGIVGGRLLGPDQTIVHGGVDFIMTRKSKFGYPIFLIPF